MWSGNVIYFVSDRDEHKRMNLYSYDMSTKETKQLTNFMEFDIKFPSLGDQAVVFENGGYIYTYSFATGKTEKITISINDDFDSGRSGLVDVSKSITNYEIAPDGSRALFGARGDIFTVPVKYGNTRNLTQTPGVHERNSKWSPDGKSIAYISDATGEDEIYIMPQDGSGTPTQLTTNGDVYKYTLYWSPDSKKILWADKQQRLLYVDVETRKVTLVMQSKVWEFTDYAWSPDSKWIAFARPEEEVMTKLCLYSLESRQIIEVTDGWFSSYEPAFSSDGKYLLFISNRTFNPSYSQTEWNHAYFDMAKIYLVTLSKETKSPFEPKSDEVKMKEEKSGKPEEKSTRRKMKRRTRKRKLLSRWTRMEFRGALPCCRSLHRATGMSNRSERRCIISATAQRMRNLNYSCTTWTSKRKPSSGMSTDLKFRRTGKRCWWGMKNRMR